MGFIQDIINGIKYMIETFKRIVCFFESVPTRIRNINSGFSNIFKGINAEFDAIGKSFNMGFSSINVLALYIGELISTNIGCGFKFFANFFDCIFYAISRTCLVKLQPYRSKNRSGCCRKTIK